MPVIGLIYEHGRFTSADTAAAARALVGYAVGLAGYAGIKVLAPAFYAFGDARTPMIVSLLSIATNFVLNWALVRHLGFGYVGLALATSAVALGNFGLLYVWLRRRIGAFDTTLAAALLRIAGVTAVMAVAVRAVEAAIAPVLPAVPWRAHALRLALAMPVGIAVFWGAGRAAGIALPHLGRRR